MQGREKRAEAAEVRKEGEGLIRKKVNERRYGVAAATAWRMDDFLKP